MNKNDENDIQRTFLVDDEMDDFQDDIPVLSKKKKPSKKEMAYVLIPTIIVAILIGFFMYGNDKAKTYNLDETYCQYYAGGTYSVEKGTTFKKNNSGKVFVYKNDEATEASSLVLYGKDTSKVFLPVDYIYYDCQGHDYYLVPAFSELIWDLKYNTKINYKKKNCNIKQGFLYDGKDYYLLLEDCLLHYDGFEMKLSKYSYVEVINGIDLVAYDRQTGENVMTTVESSVEIIGTSSEFTINAQNDSIVLHDGSKMLLFSRPEILDDIFKGVKK